MDGKTDKTKLVSETITSFLGLVILFVIGIIWNGLFMKEGTSNLGWIIYFIGGALIFFKFINKTYKWFKKLINTIRFLNQNR